MKTLRKIFTAAAVSVLASLALVSFAPFIQSAQAAIYGGTTISVNATTGTTFASAATLGATNGVSQRGSVLSLNVQNYLPDGSTTATDAVMVVVQTFQGLTVYSNTVTGSARAFPRAVATDTAGSTLTSGPSSTTNYEFNVVGIPFDGLNASVYLAGRTGLITRIKYTFTDSL